MEIFQVLDNYTKEIATKAKMREFSKKFCMRERKHFSSNCGSLPQNVRDITGLYFVFFTLKTTHLFWGILL